MKTWTKINGKKVRVTIIKVDAEYLPLVERGRLWDVKEMRKAMEGDR